MSIFQDANVSVILGDYIAADAGGKVNMIGAGLLVVGVNPDGNCAPHHVVALVDLPGKYVGDQFSLTLSLWNAENDSAVQVPGPTGRPEALRVDQMATAQAAYLPGASLPQELTIRVQMMIGFPNGLPLAAGTRYAWKAEIDGQRKKGWRANFYVLPPAPPPVIGGLAGAANIGEHGPVEEEDEVDQ